MILEHSSHHIHLKHLLNREFQLGAAPRLPTESSRLLLCRSCQSAHVLGKKQHKPDNVFGLEVGSGMVVGVQQQGSPTATNFLWVGEPDCKGSSLQGPASSVGSGRSTQVISTTIQRTCFSPTCSPCAVAGATFFRRR